MVVSPLMLLQGVQEDTATQPGWCGKVVQLDRMLFFSRKNEITI